MKDLILVESPTKARTLNTFLKGKFDIEASMGHIRDLPKSKLGVDIKNDFEPQYVIPTDKKKILKSLGDKVKNTKTVILATDPDREGEAISYHLYEMLKKKAKKAVFKRIVFHEITKEAIEEALKNPGKINDDLVSAQTARRILDRIVGYKLSPLLWRKVKVGLSAGRVQSVALRLIVEREREIEKFKKEPYFRIFATLKGKNGKETEFELIEVNQKPIDSSTKIKLYDGEFAYKKTIFNDQKKVGYLLKDLKDHSYLVSGVLKKETRRQPLPPFITSSLQQEASRRFGYLGRRTMSIAQRLYEHGFISYHRTDSFSLSQQFLNNARAFIKKEFGDKYVNFSIRTFATKSKVAQEAHEAIRPTKVLPLDALKPQIVMLGNDFFKIYELIYRRAVATQMSDGIFESSSVEVTAKGKKEHYKFKTNGLVMIFEGFLKLWQYKGEEKILPDFEKDEKLTFIQGKFTFHETTPPPRYNEASLIGSLEDHGIGRPSTYASIVSTIHDRGYVQKLEGRFQPTPIGNSTNDFLVKNFSDIDDIPFTAEMENELDEIANGNLKWVPMMREFYVPFEKDLRKAEGGARVKIELEKTDKKCPECGSDVVIRFGKFGKFYSCSKFPDCKYTAPIVKETGYICPEDGGNIIERKTRKGRIFYGCSNYPACKFAVWKITDLQRKNRV